MSSFFRQTGQQQLSEWQLSSLRQQRQVAEMSLQTEKNLLSIERVYRRNVAPSLMADTFRAKTEIQRNRNEHLLRRIRNIDSLEKKIVPKDIFSDLSEISNSRKESQDARRRERQHRKMLKERGIDIQFEETNVNASLENSSSDSDPNIIERKEKQTIKVFSGRGRGRGRGRSRGRGRNRGRGRGRRIAEKKALSKLETDIYKDSIAYNIKRTQMKLFNAGALHKSHTLWKTFKSIDTDEIGGIPRSKFQEILRKYCPTLTNDELKFLFSEFASSVATSTEFIEIDSPILDKNHKNLVQKNSEGNISVENEIEIKQSSSEMKTQNSKENIEALTSNISHMSESETKFSVAFLEKHEMTPEELLGISKPALMTLLKRIFYAVDKDKSGTLNPHEFEHCLMQADEEGKFGPKDEHGNRHHTGIEKHDARHIRESFDTDHDGVIEYEDFIMNAFEKLVSIIAQKKTAHEKELKEAEAFMQLEGSSSDDSNSDSEESAHSDTQDKVTKNSKIETESISQSLNDNETDKKVIGKSETTTSSEVNHTSQSKVQLPSNEVPQQKFPLIKNEVQYKAVTFALIEYKKFEQAMMESFQPALGMLQNSPRDEVITHKNRNRNVPMFLLKDWLDQFEIGVYAEKIGSILQCNISAQVYYFRSNNKESIEAIAAHNSLHMNDQSKSALINAWQALNSLSDNELPVVARIFMKANKSEVDQCMDWVMSKVIEMNSKTEMNSKVEINSKASNMFATSDILARGGNLIDAQITLLDIMNQKQVDNTSKRSNEIFELGSGSTFIPVGQSGAILSKHSIKGSKASIVSKHIEGSRRTQKLSKERRGDELDKILSNMNRKYNTKSSKETLYLGQSLQNKSPKRIFGFGREHSRSKLHSRATHLLSKLRNRRRTTAIASGENELLSRFMKNSLDKDWKNEVIFQQQMKFPGHMDGTGYYINDDYADNVATRRNRTANRKLEKFQEILFESDDDFEDMSRDVNMLNEMSNSENLSESNNGVNRLLQSGVSQTEATNLQSRPNNDILAMQRLQRAQWRVDRKMKEDSSGFHGLTTADATRIRATQARVFNWKRETSSGHLNHSMQEVILAPELQVKNYVRMETFSNAQEQRRIYEKNYRERVSPRGSALGIARRRVGRRRSEKNQ